MDQPHHMYEGYLFFKADPLPGHQPTWWRVERSWMCFTQVDLYTMIHQRAFQISAANQYQALSTERRLQLDQLIHERRQQDAFAEWSCAYAEEHTRVTSGQDSISHGLETIAMTAILMRRPRATKIHPRTPMGDLVDLSRLRPSIMGVTTASGLSAGRTHSHNLAVSKTHRDPIPSSTQGRASRTCLEHALFGRQSKTMNGSALPERSERVKFKQDHGSKDGSEETAFEKERNYGCDEAQRANTIHDRSDQNQRSNHKRRRIAPRIARAYRKTGYRKPGFLNRKWHPKTCQVPRKARLHRLQKILVDATEERPSIIRGHRRRNSY